MSISVDQHPWVKPALIGVLLLVLLSPAFAWASEAVGYAEPLENVAEQTGAAEHERTISPGLFPDYTVPGVNVYLGTLVAGLVGAAATLLVAIAIGRLLD